MLILRVNKQWRHRFSVAWALYEVEAEFEVQQIDDPQAANSLDLATPLSSQNELSLGLVDDEILLSDYRAILFYVSDTMGGELALAWPSDRAFALEQMFWFSEQFGSVLKGPSNENTRSSKPLSGEQKERISQLLSELDAQWGARKSPEKVRFGIVDIAAYDVFSALKGWGVDVHPFKQVQMLMERVEKRAAFLKARALFAQK